MFSIQIVHPKDQPNDLLMDDQEAQQYAIDIMKNYVDGGISVDVKIHSCTFVREINNMLAIYHNRKHFKWDQFPSTYMFLFHEDFSAGWMDLKKFECIDIDGEECDKNDWGFEVKSMDKIIDDQNKISELTCFPGSSEDEEEEKSNINQKVLDDILARFDETNILN